MRPIKQNHVFSNNNPLQVSPDWAMRIRLKMYHNPSHQLEEEYPIFVYAMCHPNKNRTKEAMLKTNDNLSKEEYIKNRPKYRIACAKIKKQSPHSDG